MVRVIFAFFTISVQRNSQRNWVTMPLINCRIKDMRARDIAAICLGDIPQIHAILYVTFGSNMKLF